MAVTVATLLAVFAFAASGAGQTETPYHIRVESNQAQAPIRAVSNLVLVPAFVFNKDRLGWITPEEGSCLQIDKDAFSALLPSEPYVWRDCFTAEMRGLSAKDFRLFDDGVEEKIESVTAERWWVAARDNMTWHAESSDTSSGIWSSTDLGARRMWPSA